MTIPESNWNNFLLNLQKKLFKVLKKFETTTNNHLNGLNIKFYVKRRDTKSVYLIKIKMLFWVILFGFWRCGLEKCTILDLLTVCMLFKFPSYCLCILT